MNNELFKIDLIILNDKIKLPIFALIGFIIALITNYISDGTYTEAESYYAFQLLSAPFESTKSAVAIFSSLLSSVLYPIISIIIISFASLTLLPRSLISCTVLLFGFNLGRFCGFAIKNALPIQCFMAILFSMLVCAMIVNYSLTALDLSSTLRGIHKKGECAVLLSPDLIVGIIKTLSLIGSIIILSIIKSFLLWLISLL